ncbi:MAG: hypothetical protein LUD72_14010 [Bacteroidales bacterium]|nr:hypothetical protein [Bacteroidales bacterium]
MLNDFYKNWIRIEGEPEPKMKPYEKCWLIGTLISGISACFIDSETWKPFAILIGIGLGIIACGLLGYKHDGGG